MHWYKSIVRAALASALLVGCGAGPQGLESGVANIFGADNRREIRPGESTLQPIGLLATGCTGTLVGRDLVLTAAHCVIDPASKVLRRDLSWFFLHLSQGTTPERAWINWVWWGTDDPRKFRHADWAIVRLDKALGERYGWLGAVASSVAAFPQAVAVAGYSVDFQGGATPWVQADCNVRGRDATMGWIYHDCDTVRGSSGAPMLSAVGPGAEIYGINVAELRDGGQESLLLPQFEESHANIAIPGQGFVQKLREIQALDRLRY